MSVSDPGNAERSRRYRARLRARLDRLEAAVGRIEGDFAARLAQLEKGKARPPKRDGDGQAAEA